MVFKIHILIGILNKEMKLHFKHLPFHNDYNDNEINENEYDYQQDRKPRLLPHSSTSTTPYFKSNYK